MMGKFTEEDKEGQTGKEIVPSIVAIGQMQVKTTLRHCYTHQNGKSEK